MRQTTITIGGSVPPGIVLGRRGENEARQIIFDISSLISTYGPGAATLLAKRPTDTTAYPVPVEQSVTTVTWTVSDVDTAYPGDGQCELYYYVGDTLAKTYVYRTSIGQDIGNASSEPPDAWQSWVDEVLAAAANIKAWVASDDGEGNITITEE